LLRGHIQLMLQERYREITVILHENRTLRGKYRAYVDARKKRYIHLIRQILTELVQKYPGRTIDPRIGTFAVLGMVNWLYQWYRSDGPIPQDQLAEQFTSLFLHGFLGNGEPTTLEIANLSLVRRREP
jgi:hypothetical protein